MATIKSTPFGDGLRKRKPSQLNRIPISGIAVSPLSQRGKGWLGPAFASEVEEN
jgi:hypothetical protein